jgi:hypothetical protein
MLTPEIIIPLPALVAFATTGLIHADIRGKVKRQEYAAVLLKIELVKHDHCTQR